jgi:hypothetical protein
MLAGAFAACGGGSKQDRGGASSKTSPAGTRTPENMLEARDRYAATLTKALRADDKQAFLAAFTGEGRRRAETWWRNLHALGASTGTAASVPSDKPDDLAGGKAVLDVGVHLEVDRRDGKQRSEPARRYGVRLSIARDGSLVSSAWRPVDGAAPWDEGRLAVRKAKGVVVAAPAAEAALAKRTLRQARTASSWVRRVMEGYDKDIVQQKGFLVFVSGDKALRNHWFVRVPKLKGWTGDAAGYAKPLPQVSADDSRHLTDGLVAGAAIVLAPPRPGRAGTGLIVHEMTHALFARFSAWFGEEPPPAWPNEGLATLVEGVYEGGTFNQSRWAGLIRDVVRSGRFDGKVPSDRKLYGGSLDAGRRAYAVAASAYMYLLDSYGAGRMLAAAQIAGSTGTPFAGIVRSTHGDRLTMYSPKLLERRWADWVRSQYG